MGSRYVLNRIDDFITEWKVPFYWCVGIVVLFLAIKEHYAGIRYDKKYNQTLHEEYLSEGDCRQCVQNYLDHKTNSENFQQMQEDCENQP